MSFGLIMLCPYSTKITACATKCVVQRHYTNLSPLLVEGNEKDTKIRIFNACVKSVLLYGCETWLVTKEIQRKLQTFVNSSLRYILRIWWPKIISNKELWKVTGQEDINVEIRNRKFRSGVVKLALSDP
jgi:hypothetical protein